MDGLINKLATAEEEFDALPLEKAGRLLTSLSRTKVYKDRVKQDMQKKSGSCLLRDGRQDHETDPAGSGSGSTAPHDPTGGKRQDDAG